MLRSSVVAFAAAVRVQVAAEPGVEVSPLVSYAGEGLEALSGKTLSEPHLAALL